MLNNNKLDPVVIGMTGASGADLGRKTVDKLLFMDVPVILTISSAARIVWQEEIDESFGVTLERWSENEMFTYHANGDMKAPIASGTFPTLGMAIIPCSMASISAISHGLSDNLIRRSADVCIKEKRPLTLVPRETPLSAIHLENMASLTRLGVTILPPNPPFYLKPQTIEDIVSFFVERTIMSLGINSRLPFNMQYNGEK